MKCCVWRSCLCRPPFFVLPFRTFTPPAAIANLFPTSVSSAKAVQKPGERTLSAENSDPAKDKKRGAWRVGKVNAAMEVGIFQFAIWMLYIVELGLKGEPVPYHHHHGDGTKTNFFPCFPTNWKIYAPNKTHSLFVCKFFFFVSFLFYTFPWWRSLHFRSFQRICVFWASICRSCCCCCCSLVGSFPFAELLLLMNKSGSDAAVDHGFRRQSFPFSKV